MRQKLLLLNVCIILLCSFATAQVKLVEKVTKKGNEIVIPYEKYILPNGLTLIIRKVGLMMPGLHLTVINTVVILNLAQASGQMQQTVLLLT